MVLFDVFVMADEDARMKNENLLTAVFTAC
jgi:hypothetical protein